MSHLQHPQTHRLVVATATAAAGVAAIMGTAALADSTVAIVAAPVIGAIVTRIIDAVLKAV
jgi:hypothetical protein